MIWERLEESYSSPEAIEKVLCTKLETFPRISIKDWQRLCELRDMLLKLEAAKQDGYLPSLTHLDTARGMNPIVEKLPYSLQEKWRTQGSSYKQEHLFAFPPFSFLSSFMHSKAKAQNDPNLDFSSPSTPPGKRLQLPRSHSNSHTPVSTHKTDVSSPHVPLNTGNGEKSKEDPDRQFPIHGKPHPLSKCRGFRSMSLEDRMQFLKECAENLCWGS